MTQDYVWYARERFEEALQFVKENKELSNRIWEINERYDYKVIEAVELEFLEESLSEAEDYVSAIRDMILYGNILRNHQQGSDKHWEENV